MIGYRSLRVAGVGPDSAGMRLGFYGFGASATIAMQVAQHWGVECYAITRSAVEVQRAQDLGAVWAGDYEAKVPVPLDAAITFAPVWPVVEQALRDTDRGACVAINAIHLDGRAQLNYDDLWWERELRSVANVTRQDVRSSSPGSDLPTSPPGTRNCLSAKLQPPSPGWPPVTFTALSCCGPELAPLLV